MRNPDLEPRSCQEAGYTHQLCYVQEVAIPLPKIVALFVVTALAEIVGSYLPYLWLKKGHSALLLVPAAASLALFARLLTLHPAAGRTYAAYGGVYMAIALFWLWRVDGVTVTIWDRTRAAVSLVGMGIIVLDDLPPRHP